MHTLLCFSTILLVTFRLSAAIPLGRLGLCLGNQLTNKAPKGTADFLADLQAITKLTSGSVKLVRTYGAGGLPPTAQGILQAAKQTGFQVLLGAWVADEETWQAEKAALQAAIPSYEDQVYGIAVGSEGLYRTSYTAAALASWMKDARATWPNINVGTADTASSYISGSADPVIFTNPPLLLANAFPYWTNQFIQNATAGFFDQALDALHQIQNVSSTPDKIHYMVGETGWPGDGGDDFGNAVASTVNAQAYFYKAVCPALANGIDVFWLEAFDEPQKDMASAVLNGKTLPINEFYWGAMDKDRNFKLNLTCPDT